MKKPILMSLYVYSFTTLAMNDKTVQTDPVDELLELRQRVADLEAEKTRLCNQASYERYSRNMERAAIEKAVADRYDMFSLSLKMLANMPADGPLAFLSKKNGRREEVMQSILEQLKQPPFSELIPRAGGVGNN